MNAREKVFDANPQVSVSPKGPIRQRDSYRRCTVVAVCNQRCHGIGRKPWMNVENIATTWTCVENMILAATADGIGAQISILREEHKIAVERLLGITEDHELATMLLIGLPGEFGKVRPDFSWLQRNSLGAAATLQA
jgi:hypothetical protein